MNRLFQYVGIFSLVLGMTLIAKPRQSIEFQIAFYRLLNWKMEPLDWKREILSTRIMGGMAVCCGLAALWLA